MNNKINQVQVKKLVFSLLFALLPMTIFAQEDPVIMKINGQPVSRSEFEYSYNKNNSEGVIDKKSVEEYVDLFVNYKLKVEAAKDAHLDTLKTFKDEFTSYRDQQIRPAFITDADVEKEAQKIYKETQKKVATSTKSPPYYNMYKKLLLNHLTTVQDNNTLEVVGNLLAREVVTLSVGILGNSLNRLNCSHILLALTRSKGVALETNL